MFWMQSVKDFALFPWHTYSCGCCVIFFFERYSHPWGRTTRRRQRERTELTRTRLVEAVERVFMRNGFQATTLEAIAKVAGRTSGQSKPAHLSCCRRLAFWCNLPRSDLIEDTSRKAGFVGRSCCGPKWIFGDDASRRRTIESHQSQKQADARHAAGVSAVRGGYGRAVWN
jgi:hypothetical protein